MKGLWLHGIRIIQLYLCRKRWRKANTHNFTDILNKVPMDRITVGNNTYGWLDVSFDGNPDEYVEIGHFCSIAPNVTFIASGGHPYTNLSTYPFMVMLLGEPCEALCKGKISVGDDVWIGYGATILSGVSIGQGAIIGAGSVVAKDIPPYAIFAGGTVLKMRFPPHIVEKLMKFDYSTLDRTEVGTNLDLLYHDLGDLFFSSDLYKKHCRL